MCTVTSQCPGLTLLRLDIYRFAVIYLSFLSGWPEIVDNFVRYKFRYRPLESQNNEKNLRLFVFSWEEVKLFYFIQQDYQNGRGDLTVESLTDCGNFYISLLHTKFSLNQPNQTQQWSTTHVLSRNQSPFFTPSPTLSFLPEIHRKHTFSLFAFNIHSRSLSLIFSLQSNSHHSSREKWGGCNCMTWP